MEFWISNGMGDSIDSPTPEQMRTFLDEIDASDEEHGAAWLEADGVILEWNGDGRLVRDGLGGSSGHLSNITRERVIELWCAAVRGDLAMLDALPWRPGNGYVLTPEKKAEMDGAMHAMELRFYEELGAERSDVPCRREGCDRGAVQWSVHCRVHHYEGVRGTKCPFRH